MAGKVNTGKVYKCLKKIRPVIWVLVIVLGIFASFSFAKYYSLQKQKGVALASDFYFTSDILKSDITISNGVPTKISPYIATNVWNPNGTLSTVTFLVRNYANSLLYNDENIGLEYDLYAMLKEEESNGIAYYLVYGSGQEVRLSTTPVKISDTLAGGEPLSNSYAIQYRYTSGIKVLPKDVYLWVVPTAPSYIPVGEYSMGSLVSVRETVAKFTFENGWGFLTLDDASENLTDEQMGKINAQAGFVYNISTSGSNTEGNDKDKVEVILTWNSKYIELDRFCKFYREEDIVTDGNGMKSLIISINTYTSNDILFYRTSDFLAEDFTTQGDFMGLVNATMVINAQ